MNAEHEETIDINCMNGGTDQVFDLCSQFNQENAPVISTVVKRSPRVEWTLLTAKREGGKAPCLVDDCPKDREFLSLMRLYKPFCAPHGTKGSKWQEVANEISKSLLSTGELMFPAGLTRTTCEKRWNRIVDTFKNFDTNAPFRSGDDDEEDNGVKQLMSDCISLYKDHKANTDERKETNKKTAARKKEDRVVADKIRQQMIGGASRKEIRKMAAKGKKKKTMIRDETKEKNGSGAGVGVAAAAAVDVDDVLDSSSLSSSDLTSPASKTQGNSATALMSSVLTMKEGMEKRQEGKKRRREEQRNERELLRKERNEERRRRLKMEEDRLKMDQERMAQDVLDRQQARVQSVQMAQVLGSVVTMLNNLQNNNQNINGGIIRNDNK